MGLFAYFGKKVIQATFLFLLVVVIPGLPPYDMDFTTYSVTAALPLEGPLALNTKLNNAERLFENQLKGPEGLAVYNGELYTGIHGGHIVKIKNDTIIPVLKFGKACEGLWEENKCGRVLGITFDKDGSLYAADAYYGLFKVNMTTGSVDTIAQKDEVIHGKPVKLPNAVDVSVDGNVVYWTISSTSHDLNDGLYTLFGDGNGRLMRTDLKQKVHEVLLEDLHFPNGVILSDDESFVLVAETARGRVVRYYLKGVKKGTSDVFIDGLPGLPDNLKKDAKDGFYIPLVKPVDKDHPNIPAIIASYPLLRKFIVRIFSLMEYSIKFLNELYPSIYLQQALHFVGHFESVNIFSGKRVTIVRTDSDGKIVESLHSTDSSMSDICDVEYFNGAYYLASPFNPYLGRVVASEPV